jgi:hypothetical protein
MELKTVRMKIPEESNLILGQTHFIKELLRPAQRLFYASSEGLCSYRGIFTTLCSKVSIEPCYCCAISLHPCPRLGSQRLLFHPTDQSFAACA